MGWTVLYIAFGVVALWLLGEVLLQYKARLCWRLLAFAGFLGVVVGVLMPSVIVIGVGAIAFAIGQTYVTLSFRRGFAAGWAVKRPDAETGGGSKRRRGKVDRHDPEPAATAGPEHEGTAADRDADQAVYGQAQGDYDDYDRDDVFTPARAGGPTAAETTAVYEPQPMPEDTGSYGVYGDTAAHAAAAQQQGTGQQAYAYDYSGYGQQGYGYDATGQQAYANYSDPYIGNQTYGGAPYDPGYAGQYGQQGYAQDPYAGGGYGQTPAGGVWVPQQRTDETYGGELPQEQPYPYQGQEQGHGHAQQPQPGAGFDEQYRF
ncbi:SCO2102 family sporulation regulator [Streptomyces sp. NPDC001118]